MSDENREKIFFHAWNVFPEIGPKRFQKLLVGFPSLEHAWGASEKELERTGIELPIIEALRRRDEINPETEWEKLQELEIAVLTISDASYPPLLKEI
ncbi:hypothetical protein HYW30_01155, partial [Candidatus Azambacteria bacterium]|nr:hypothetical protein [Candidatus Azambacteria bacterium]